MTATVLIDSIAAGGEGVGRFEDGMTVFVHRTAPGDRAEIAVTERKARWARGRLVRVLEPGPDRVEPVCHHYVEDDCGGCQLQHLSGPAQRRAKGRMIGDALRRIGGQSVDDPPVVEAPAELGYRTRVRFTARADGSFGYRPYHDAGRGFVVRECPVAAPGIMAVWRAVAPAVAREPAVEGVTIRLDRADRIHVMIAGTNRAQARVIRESAGVGDAAVVWAGTGMPIDGTPADRAAPPPTVFEQVNPRLVARIRADVVHHLHPAAGETGWDLYAGAGDTAVELAEPNRVVWAVDADAGAIEWARHRRDVPSTVRFRVGRVEDVIGQLPDPGFVVVNPPRAGLSPAVTRSLNERARAGMRLAYVSCDPATLARDVRRLAAFEMTVVRGYDLFPQTGHVETLAGFTGRA